LNIGIIVHSQTEHTYSVAQMLEDKLSETGHTVKVEQVVAAGGPAKPRDKNVKLEAIPDVSGYDALIFGAPVHAFSLSAAMTAYLNQLPSLEGKKIICFVTKGLRFNWTGGNQAINKMSKICQSKNGTVIGTDIIIWNKNRDKKINEMVNKFSTMF
jgi:NAD(P)H dehydrogenase (quinone)